MLLSLLRTLIVFSFACCLYSPLNAENGESRFTMLLKQNSPVWYKHLLSGGRQSYWMNMPDYSNKDFKNRLARLFDEWYTTLHQKDAGIKRKNRIPRIIHIIWLGSPLPDSVKKTIASWKTALPSWTMMVWDDAALSTVRLINQRLYDSAPNYAEKSDIARIELLKSYGGLYIDVDCEIINPLLLEQIHDSCIFYAGLESLGGWLIIGNAVIGSVPNHPLLKAYIDKLAAWHVGVEAFLKLPDLPPWTSTCLRTGPGFFSSLIYSFLKRGASRLCILPPQFFYPCIKGEKPVFSAETCIYHRFDSLWLTPSSV